MVAGRGLERAPERVWTTAAGHRRERIQSDRAAGSSVGAACSRCGRWLLSVRFLALCGVT